MMLGKKQPTPKLPQTRVLLVIVRDNGTFATQPFSQQTEKVEYESSPELFIGITQWIMRTQRDLGVTP